MNFKIERFIRLIWKKRSFEEWEREILRYKKAGVEYIELGGDVLKAFPEKFLLNKDVFYKACQKHGILLGLHLPDLGMGLESWWERSRKGLIKDIQEFIEEMKPLEFENFILHLPLTEKFLSQNAEERTIQRQNFFQRWLIKSKNRIPLFNTLISILKPEFKDLLDELLNFNCNRLDERAIPNLLKSLEELQVWLDLEKICIENSEFVQSNYYQYIIEQLAKRRKSIHCCVDIGHMKAREFIEQKEIFVPFLEKNHSRIREFHIHDVKWSPLCQTFKDHLPLVGKYKGVLNIKNILKTIKDFDLNVPIVLENPDDDPIPSIEFLAETLKNL